MADALYFSQVTLDFGAFKSHPTFGATRPYLEHQVACDLFGQYEERPFLYRSDLAQGAAGTLLVLSTLPPETPGPNAITYGFTSSIRTTRFPTDFRDGTVLDFEIRRNATKVVPTVPGKRSKRVDVWEHARRGDPTNASRDGVYGEYLRQRLGPVATVLAAHVTERSFITVGRKSGSKSPIRFVATNVIGTVAIDDPHGFVEMLRGGIGKSRGFGCGMLCLSKPGTVLPRRYSAAPGATLG